MPGDISTGYDPEWGSCYNRDQIEDVLTDIYRKVSTILSNEPPMYVVELAWAENLDRVLPAEQLTEQEWRLIRFAIERAIQSL